ncbi:MarR family transcriptional regulator, partial [Faecalibaculum rodentium]
MDLFRKELKNELKDLPPLRQKDFQVLEYIWTANPEHSVRMSDLTQFMEVSPAATSQLINSYEMQEIAQRVRSTEDRRANFVQ